MYRTLFAACLISGCLFSNNNDSGTDAGIPFYGYQIVQDSLLGTNHYLILKQNHVFKQCVGDSLVQGDSILPKNYYELKGDSLHFWYVKDYSDSTIQGFDVYFRLGSGSSLKGNWRRVKGEIANPNGSPIDSQFAIDRVKNDSMYRNELMVIDEKSISLFYERTPEQFVWSLIESAPKSITHVFLNQNKTLFIKNMNDTVTFISDSISTKVSSSNKKNESFFLFQIPKFCPVEATIPAWYYGFFEILLR